MHWQTQTFYACYLDVNLGRQPRYVLDNSSLFDVQRLEPVKGANRNITVDNWFPSIELINTLKKNFQLTYLGTIRKNIKELLLQFSNRPKQHVEKNMFAFRKNITLVSYIPKKSRNALLVSSLYHDDKIDETTGKLEMIVDYNSIKGGMDTLHKMCAAYHCSTNTSRWPMTVFYALLNMGGVNSMVVYFLNNHDITLFSRRKFLRKLSFELVESHLP